MEPTWSSLLQTKASFSLQVLLRQQSPQAAIVTRRQQLLLAAVEEQTLVPHEGPAVAAAWSLDGQRLALVDQQTVRTAEVLSDGTLDTSEGQTFEPKSQVRFSYKVMHIACVLLSSLMEQIRPAFALLAPVCPGQLRPGRLSTAASSSPTPADCKHKSDTRG